MDFELLSLLCDGQFHSGAELGNRAGVSRAAVSKRIRRLEQALESDLYKVPGRGYRLPQAISLIRAPELAAQLATLGWELDYHLSLDSTNAECRRNLPHTGKRPLLVLAEHQTAGRGRRGRTWLSPPFKNIYASIALEIPPNVPDLPAMSLVVGYAVAKTLRELGVVSVGLKWPNDVYLGSRKVAGVLLELTGDPSDVCVLIAGVGINVNVTEYEAGPDQPWTSLRLTSGRLHDRTVVAEALCRNLAECFEVFFRVGFGPFKEVWEALQVWRGERCNLVAGDQVVTGTVLGVAADGALRVSIEGTEQSFHAGELSLRRA